MWRVARAAGGQDGSPAAFPPKQVVHRWYLGGLASAAAAACTHPLDLLKVHLQTQQEGKRGLWEMGVRVVQTQGVRGLYNGLTASLTRQLTYSTTRFGVYEVLKAYLLPDDGSPLPFHYKIVMGATGGFFGGIVGSPFDAVNVRMQNDMKLPAELRRKSATNSSFFGVIWSVYKFIYLSQHSYKHVVDGVIRISKEGIY
jgi:hypothetical protein